MDAFFDKFSRIPAIQKIGGMLLICLLLVVAYYMMGYNPKIEKQEKLANRIADLESSLEEKKKMVGDLSQYKREVEQLNQDLQKAIKLLPNRSEIPTLLQKISSLAQKSGLEILTFQPKPEVPQDFYAKVPVGLRLIGSYNEITNFFDAVGKLSRIVNIDNFNFAPSSANKMESSKKRLMTNCVATTFRFIPQPDPPAKKKK